MVATSVESVESTPGFCGGRARIAGHRIRVADIVAWHEFRGYSADEIAGMFPGLTLGNVYAALSYYFDNRDLIEAEIRADEELSSSSRNAPSKLRGILRGR